MTLNLCNLDFPQYMVDYLERNADLFLAGAYQGYLQKGRGMLWIDWLNKLPITSPLTEVSVIYVPIRGRMIRTLKVPNDAIRFMLEYDPQTMIVIRWDDGQLIRNRTIALSETPPSAYERMAGRLDEFTFWLGKK